MNPKFQVQLKIRKSAAEVFDGVANPAKLSRYFISASSGPLVEGTTVKWTFPEFPGEHDVVVREVKPNERIVLEWAAAEGGYNTRIEMTFTPLDADNTMVQISESGWRTGERDLKSSYDNCGGWMHMMCCLKAFLEYDINLRAGGAF